MGIFDTLDSGKLLVGTVSASNVNCKMRVTAKWQFYAVKSTPSSVIYFIASSRLLANRQCTYCKYWRTSLQPNTCLCDVGWMGDKCDECVPYPSCPLSDGGTCNEPNQCICPASVDNDVCNKEYINGTFPCLMESSLFAPVYPLVFQYR